MHKQTHQEKPAKKKTTKTADAKLGENSPAQMKKSAPIDSADSPPAHVSGQDNEGEGSYTGTRRYDAGVRDFVASGQVNESAREAERAVDGPEGVELSKAEQRGKRGRA